MLHAHIITAVLQKKIAQKAMIGKFMRDILKNSGMRWTRQRQLIYDEISLEKGHYTAETIKNKLCEKNINTGLSTIYRTLQLLEENNIIRRVPLGLGTTVYESCDGKNHGHHHMHCTKCGKTMEIHVDMLDGLEKIIKTKYNFTITGHTVMFTGLCNSCAKKQSDYRK